MPRPPISKQSKASGQARPASVVVPYAATITPDAALAATLVVGVLTGPLTVAAPINARLGDRLCLILPQDGTGGRNVTWNAIYKNAPAISGAAANAINCPEFVYNGTNWIYVA